MPRTIKIVLPDPVTDEMPLSERTQAAADALVALEKAAGVMREAIAAAQAVGLRTGWHINNSDWIRNLPPIFWAEHRGESQTFFLEEASRQAFEERREKEDAEKKRREAKRAAKEAASAPVHD